MDELVSSIGKEIEEEGGKLDEVQQLGRREFAYNANNVDGGHYVNFLFEAEPEVIDKIQVRLKLNSLIYLQHYQRLS